LGALAMSQDSASVTKSQVVPDEDLVMIRIHHNNLDQNKIKAGAFVYRGQQGEEGISCDWKKYSSVEESRNRGRDPSKNMIAILNVGKIRTMPVVCRQRVIHTPTKNNFSHCDIVPKPLSDPEYTEVRLQLVKCVISLQ
jgi:hypothetical protein